MLNKNRKTLAINGGTPVTKKVVLIHLPYLDEDDFQIVNETIRSTFVSGDGPECRKFETEMKRIFIILVISLAVAGSVCANTNVKKRVEIEIND